MVQLIEKCGSQLQFQNTEIVDNIHDYTTCLVNEIHLHNILVQHNFQD